MNHETTAPQWLRPPGVEIGAFQRPIPGIAPIYVDKFAEFAGQPCRADYYGEAVALPFRDDSLRYVASSHVLEHTANVIQALKEWVRVLRDGGIIYLVVPDRRHTWDHGRTPTPISHFFADYERGVTAVDATHIDEFVDGVDWSTYSPATAPGQVAAEKAKLKQTYHEAVASGREINIHFHVFEPRTMVDLVAALRRDPRWGFDGELVECRERFPSDNPNGFLAVIRVRKGLRSRLAGFLNGRRHRHDPSSILAPDARPFPVH